MAADYSERIDRFLREEMTPEEKNAYQNPAYRN